MTYIESLLPKTLMFEIKPVGLKLGVFEQVKRENLTIDVGCVFIGKADDCRKYIAQRRSQQAIRAEERGTNPQITQWGK